MNWTAGINPSPSEAGTLYGPGSRVEESQLLFVTSKNDSLALDENAIPEREELLDRFRALDVGAQGERTAKCIACRATDDCIPVILEPV